ncbi:MAG: Lipase (class 3) [Firmicutes bacterium ADurb.Bin262]|nr:MAG: Lipase (class 3) [Firmicutes bacterium ADurb.Bin262]
MGGLNPHSHTLSGGQTTYTYKNLSDTQHEKTASTSQVKCTVCDYVKAATSVKTNESHSFSGNTCTKCGAKQVEKSIGIYLTNRTDVPLYEKASSYSNSTRRLSAINTRIEIFSISINEAGNYWGRTINGDYVWMGNLKAASGSYTAKFKSSVANKDITVPFYYSDTLFSATATQLNRDLGKASVCLSAATYNKENIKSVLEKMGYVVIRQVNYEKAATRTDNDFVGYTVARKFITINSQSHTIYCVFIQGTPGNAQWHSNFNIGTGGIEHAGFTKAADQVWADITSGIPSTYASTNKIWLVGHSRGAAVANIIAGKLTASQKYASASNIYAYTFACPTVLTTANTSNKNIWNFNNNGDLITQVPLTKWGFKRNGQTKTLNSVISTRIPQCFSVITGSSFNGRNDYADAIAVMNDWCPTVSKYYDKGVLNWSVKNFMDDIACMLYGGAFDEVNFAAKIISDPNHIGSFADKLNLVVDREKGMREIAHGHCQETYIAWLYSGEQY